MSEIQVTRSGKIKLTTEEISYLESFLARGDRGGYYIALYNIIGTPQCIEQAQIATFSEGSGGVAYSANFILQQAAPTGEYPGIYYLSQKVAESSLNFILNNMENGGTGYIDVAEMFASADAAWREVWPEKSLQNYFPGNFLDRTLGVFVPDLSLPPLPDENSTILALIQFYYDFQTGNVPITFEKYRNRLVSEGFLAGLVGLGGGSLLGKTLSDYENDPNYRIESFGDGKYKTAINLEKNKVVGIFDTEIIPSNLTDLLNKIALYLPTIVAAGNPAIAVGVYEATEFIRSFLVDFRKSLTETSSPFNGDIDPILVNNFSGDEIFPLSSAATAENETRWGSSSTNDTISGGAGDDRLFGGDGDDLLHGDEDKDILYGQGGSDSLHGDAGDDILRGGDGNDFLSGGIGNDVLDGDDITPNSTGHDTLHGDQGDDTLQGGSGNDIIVGGDGKDVLHGGNGNDILFAGNGNQDIEEIGGDYIEGNDGNDYLFGGIGHDTLDGGSGADDMYDDEGNDTLRGIDYAINDTLQGGLGNDTYYIDANQNGFDLVVEIDGGGYDKLYVQGDSISFTTPENIEDIIFLDSENSSDIKITGNSLSNHIQGNSKNNILVGNGGADKIFGGDGNDTLFATGWSGNDLQPEYIYGSNAKDLMPAFLYGGRGFDTYAVDGAGFVISDQDGAGAILLDGVQLSSSSRGTFQWHRYENPATTYSNSGAGQLIFTSESRLSSIVIENWKNGDLGITIDEISAQINNLWRTVEPQTLININGQSLTVPPVCYLGKNSFNSYTTTNFPTYVPTNEAYSITDGYGFTQDKMPSGLGPGVKRYGDYAYNYDYFRGSKAVGAEYYFSRSSGSHSIDITNGELGDVAGIRIEHYVKKEDVSFWRNGDDLYISISESNILEVKNWYLPLGYEAKYIVSGSGDLFLGLLASKGLDGWLVSAEDLASIQHRDPRLLGDGGNNSITGSDGNDIISGESGNDLLFGGGGNDKLYGGKGDDIYTFGESFGKDLVNESTNGSGVDVIKFNFNHNQNTILSRTEFDLIITSGNSEITVRNWFSNPSARIERVEFLDGTIWEEEFLLNASYRGLIIEGSSFSDELTGGRGSDIVDGHDGHDHISTLDGNDTLHGGVGNDTLEGGIGNDTYTFSRGDGKDLIINSGNNPENEDSLIFSEGISAGDISLSKDVNGTLYLQISNSEDEVSFINFFTDDQFMIRNIKFFDGTVWNGNMISTANLIGTSENDYLTGSNTNDRIEAFSGDDALFGDAGNDTLLGNAGNDDLSGGFGADSLVGGQGNDNLSGDAGSDIYVFNIGDGQDAILEGNVTAGDIDTVRLGAGISSSDVSLFRSPDGSLIIALANGFDSIAVSGFFNSIESEIERVEFANGSVWNSSTLKTAALIGTNSSDYLYGSTGNDSINGLGGDDYLIGDSGADTISGEIGNDTLEGGTGNDIYTYRRGDGSDFIVEASGTDTIRFGPGISQSDVMVSRDDFAYFLNINGTSDRITISDWYSGSAYRIENVEFSDGSSWNSTTINSKTTTATQYADFYWGTSGANTYNGLDGDDKIYGFEGNDSLSGGVGNDLIDGGVDDDVMTGGTGDDTYIVDSVTDTVVEVLNEGIDTVQSTVSYTLASNIENLSLLDSGGAINGTGNTSNNVLAGSAFNNLLSGAAGNDQLIGGEGNDTLDGGTDQDTMLGGLGNDTYVVDDVSDAVIEAMRQGTDTVQSSITYTLGANIEKLTLTGSAAINATGNELDNTLTGNSAANVLTGGEGNDSLNGGAGADTMVGGLGDDIYTVDNAGDVITELTNQGLDHVKSSITYTLGMSLENLTLTGSGAIAGTGNAEDNVLVGNAGNNTLTGLAGDDRLDGAAGNDTMLGGIGNDTYVFDAMTDVATEYADEGVDTVETSVTLTSLGANIENMTLLEAGGAISGTGNALNNVITGNTANNTLNGGAGADTLMGGLGNDTYVADSLDTIIEAAGGGTDTLQSATTVTLLANHVENLLLTGSTAINGSGNSLDNTLTGNSAANVLSGGLGNDTYVLGTGDTVVENAGEGIDTVQSSLTSTLTSNVENLLLTGSSAINGSGNELDNALTGNSAANLLNGMAGNDVLDGKAGADTLVGGTGDDAYVIDNSGDVVTENLYEGIDTVQASISYSLGSNVENLTLTGSAALNGTGNSLNNTLMGNSGANTLTGGAGDDLLNGGAGNDTLLGGTGNDTYVVNVATDVVTENADEGTDTIQSSVTLTLGANVENLTLTGTANINGTGNSLSNVLIGTSGNNTLTGADGNDTLNGGSGTDTLIGGIGNDTYIMGPSFGADLLQETDATAGNTDVLQFLGGISSDQLWFRKVSNNLEVSVIGTGDKATVQNWYLGSQYHVEQFKTADGKVLLDSQVQNLVNAMASFAPPSAGQLTLPASYQTGLMPVIAANWQG